MESIISIDSITQKILIIRGYKVILDSDLAKLYGVETGRLNEQVRRNIKRFPKDFMFQITKNEYSNLISQNAISRWGGRRKLPLVFTEQGVAMLSSVLKSEKAINVNIFIMRAFVKLREIIASNKDLEQRINELEKKYNEQFIMVFKILRQMAIPLDSGKKQNKKIGFMEKDKGTKL